MLSLDEEKLRDEYTVKKNTRLERARKLDFRCRIPALVNAYVLGVCGALILGIGMCLAMGVIGAPGWGIPLGTVAGLVGVFLVSINYPIYRTFLNRRKEKYASAILSVLNEKN